MPTVTPIFGPLRLPKNRTRILPKRTDHSVQHISAKFAFRDWFDDVARKPPPKDSFKLNLLSFALELLRALLSFAFQLFDLALHRCDLFFLLGDFMLEAIFRF